MPRGLPREAATHLEKAKESALLAVEVYNKPAIKFRSGGYIVLMNIAWTSLFHAMFFRDKTKPFYRRRDNPKRFEKIDGDYKAWELSKCLDEHFGGQHSPIRENLRFLIGLRNKIEHRSMPALDHRIFGECQACLFNFEDLLLSKFGSKHAINESLTLSLQFSHLRDEQQTNAITKLYRPLAQNVARYVSEFRSGLSTDVFSDQRFSYRVFLIPRIVNHASQADNAMEFVKYDPNNPQQVADYEKLVTLIRPTVTPVVNPGKLKAGDVCKKVTHALRNLFGAGRKFVASYHHAKACDFYKVRPKRGAGDPKKTEGKFCQYDEAHDDYVYTEQWVVFLTEELKKPGQYEQIIGAKPSDQSAA